MAQCSWKYGLGACLGLWLASAAQACSPVIVTLEELLDGAARSQQRFTAIALVEVVGTRASRQRLEQFVEWRSEQREAQQRRAWQVERQRELDATWQDRPGGPPKPPPESPWPEPVMVPEGDPMADVHVEVLEQVYGTGPLQLTFAQGGPCGRIPAVGEHLLALEDYTGIVRVLPPPAGKRWFQDALIDAIRDCMVRGGCRKDALPGS